MVKHEWCGTNTGECVFDYEANCNNCKFQIAHNTNNESDGCNEPCPFCGNIGFHDEDCYIWMQAMQAGCNVPIYSEEEWYVAWDKRYERTCRNINNDAGFTCSACGCYIDEDDLSYFEGRGSLVFLLHYPHYCPSCGAKVVR